MSICLRCFLIFFCGSFLFSQESDGGEFVFDVSGSLDEGGKALAAACSWSWKASPEAKQVPFFEKKRFESCEKAWEYVSQHYPLMLKDKELFWVSDAMLNYRPEYISVASIKKQLRTWMNAKILKKWGFFEESGVVRLEGGQQSVLASMDLPQKQIHLRAVVWVVDEYDHSQLGLDASWLDMHSFDEWLSRLQQLEQFGKVQVLAQPELLLVAQHKAVVSSGEEIPFLSTHVKKPHVQFKKALMALNVKAKHVGDLGAFLDVDITFDKPSDHYYQGNVAIVRQRVKSSLRLNFHQMYMLGGVKQHRATTLSACFPLLSSLPWVGDWFCTFARRDRQSLLFVTLMIHPA